MNPLKILIFVMCVIIGIYVSDLYKTGSRILDSDRIHSMKCLSPAYNDFVVVENIIHPDGGYRVQRFNCPITFMSTKDEFHIRYDYQLGDPGFKPIRAIFYVKDFKEITK